MRLLVDANVAYRLVAVLQKVGHDVLSILETSPNITDEEVIRLALKEKRTIVTCDKDFGELIFKKGLAHRGIILLRVRDERFQTQAKLLQKFFSKHSTKEIQEHFWVLTDSDSRVRS